MWFNGRGVWTYARAARTPELADLKWPLRSNTGGNDAKDQTYPKRGGRANVPRRATRCCRRVR